ncbi:MAG: hypothetical protein FWF83_02765 [Clostridiales bacterium]|nr:hypothetical protein [Clostridiales bacterium]
MINDSDDAVELSVLDIIPPNEECEFLLGLGGFIEEIKPGHYQIVLQGGLVSSASIAYDRYDIIKDVSWHADFEIK